MRNKQNQLHKEFQVDAVFAIVIILMAIEIHIPETEEIKSAAELNHALSHLFPTSRCLLGALASILVA